MVVEVSDEQAALLIEAAAHRRIESRVCHWTVHTASLAREAYAREMAIRRRRRSNKKERKRMAKPNQTNQQN
jgi:hypothetical protein